MVDGALGLGAGGQVLWTCCGSGRSGPLGLRGSGRPHVSPTDLRFFFHQNMADFFTKMNVIACLTHSSVFLSLEVFCQKSMKLVDTANKLLPTTQSNLQSSKSIFIDYSYTIHVQFVGRNLIVGYICWNRSQSCHPKHAPNHSTVQRCRNKQQLLGLKSKQTKIKDAKKTPLKFARGKMTPRFFAIS